MANKEAQEELRERIVSQSCLACGAAGASLLQLERFWSFFLFSTRTQVEDYLCAPCGVRKVRRELWRTALFGWWGIPWGLLTPLYLARQLRELVRVGGSAFLGLIHLPIALLIPALLLGGYVQLSERAGHRPAIDPDQAALVLYRKQQYVSAIALLRSSLTRSNRASTRVLLADCLFASGQLKESAQELKILLDKQLDMHALLLLVRVHSELGQSDRGEAWLGKGLSKWPDNARLYRVRGDLRQMRGSLHAALSDYRAARRIEDKDMAVRLRYVRLAALLGKRQQLLREAQPPLAMAELFRDPARKLRVLLKLSPVTPSLRLAAARVLATKGDDLGARKQLQASGLLAPEGGGSRLDRRAAWLLEARLALRRKDDSRTEQALVEAQKLGVPPLTLGLAWARAARFWGDWDAAARWYRKLRDRRPQSVLMRIRIHRLWASSERERGDMLRAAQLLEATAGWLPPRHVETARVMRDAGLVSMAAGRYELALAQFEQMLGGDAPFVEIRQTVLLYRALCQFLLSRPQLGRRQLRPLARFSLERSTAHPFPVLSARFLLGQLSETALIGQCRQLGPLVENDLWLVRALKARSMGRTKRARRALSRGVAAGGGRGFPYHLLRRLAAGR